MRFGSRPLPGAILLLALVYASPHASTLSPLHQQRYANGTMCDIIVFHPQHVDVSAIWISPPGELTEVYGESLALPHSR